MAVAGSAVSSIYLELDPGSGELVVGATMLRQAAAVCAEPAEAWHALTEYGRCYLRLYGTNMMQLCALHAAWLSARGASA